MKTRMMQKMEYKSTIALQIIGIFEEFSKTRIFNEKIRILVKIYRMVDNFYKHLEQSDSLHQLSDAVHQKFVKSVIEAVERLIPQINTKMMEKKEIDDGYMRTLGCIHLMRRIKKNYEKYESTL